MFFATALLTTCVLLAVFGAGVADVKTDAIMDDALVEILWEEIFEDEVLNACLKPDSIKQCFISEGIPITGHSSLAGVPLQQQPSVQDRTLARSNNNMCQPDELPRFQRAISCVMNEMVVKCQPPGNDYKSLIPDPTRLRNMLNLLCKNAQHLNISCLRSRYSALKACIERKAHDLVAKSSDHELEMMLSQAGQMMIMCSATRISAECHKDVIAPCGCVTTYTLVEIAKRYLAPTTCHIDVATPVCDPNTFQFISGGAAGLMQLKAWPLAAVSLLIGYASAAILSM